MNSAGANQRLIVSLTGATGALYGIRLLEHARTLGIETHLVLSSAAILTAQQELGVKRADIEALASHSYNAADISARIASGSFLGAGMVIAPCSMKTLAAVAQGLSDNLISRAADVCLKERRRLILLTREAPLNLAHLKNMEAVTLMGGIIFPPVPAFYLQPANLTAMVDHTLGRVLDLLGFENELAPRWEGLKK